MRIGGGGSRAPRGEAAPAAAPLPVRPSEVPEPPARPRSPLASGALRQPTSAPRPTAGWQLRRSLPGSSPGWERAFPRRPLAGRREPDPESIMGVVVLAAPLRAGRAGPRSIPRATTRFGFAPAAARRGRIRTGVSGGRRKRAGKHGVMASQFSRQGGRSTLLWPPGEPRGAVRGRAAPRRASAGPFPAARQHRTVSDAGRFRGGRPAAPSARRRGSERAPRPLPGGPKGGPSRRQRPGRSCGRGRAAPRPSAPAPAPRRAPEPGRAGAAAAAAAARRGRRCCRSASRGCAAPSAPRRAAMFGQQHLLRLQQLLQPPPPPPPSRAVTLSQQQMLTLQAASPASLLNANPVLQRALLIQQMQGNLRGFNVAAAPVLQQFFPQATRHSLLGPPPVGVSLKPPHLAFSALPFPRQNRAFRKDFPRIAERKREADGASSSAQGQGEEGAALVGKRPGSPPSETPLESPRNGEPAAKQLRSEAEISNSGGTTDLPDAEEAGAESQLEDADPGEGDVAPDALEENFEEEVKTSEVVSNAGALKVTIQQSSESRAISTTTARKPGPSHPVLPAGPGAALNFYCYICRMNCCNQQNFQTHMAGVQHQQRLQEIQRMSNVCLVSLLPMAKEPTLPAERDGENQQRWCNTCQLNFRGDLIRHRRTQEHKLAKRFLRPFCTVCSRYFKTPRKFVEHMKSLEHKQKAKEARLAEKELGGPEDSEELITVDAVGCFEEQDEEEEEEEEEAGEADQLDSAEALNPQVGQREASVEDPGGNAEYCPDTVYGLDFLVPVAGFLCRLCHKFYSSDSATRLAHCKSLMHFENLQRYRASQLQATAVHAEAPPQPPQGVTDRQAPPSAKMQDAEEAVTGHRRITTLGAPPGATRRCPGDFETEDICGAPAIDEKCSPSPVSDDSLGQDPGVPGEGAGLCTPGERPSPETQQKAAVDSASADQGDAAPRQGAGSWDREPPTLADGEAVSACRRSSWRRAR
ncbi:cip1-interacting zinc finger protein [Candoia aspera]|uniref:cip1-interacting zinc finger protein n=1 Tax=Candoia aspera TaxID=51853 RepID=UPI002FD81841